MALARWVVNAKRQQAYARKMVCGVTQNVSGVAAVKVVAVTATTGAAVNVGRRIEPKGSSN